MSGVIFDPVLGQLRTSDASGGTSSPLTTKGDIYGYSTTNARIPVGADGTVLTADSTQTLGVKWNAVSGTGTVTSVSVVTANGVSGSVANATTTPAITLTLGAITPTSVNSVVVSGSSTPTLAVTGTSSISGANTGDQTITLTGAVTGSGTGSFATTLATPGTLTVSSTNSNATAHTHAITSSSAPGAAASLLSTDASGIIGSTGTRIVKGWFTDLTVTNAIAGSITGNAATVTTNANLTGDVTSVGNATTLTNAPVIAKVLTGYVSGAGTVSATDSILQAIQKLNGNDATNANLTGVITSVGNATSIASQTGTGTKFVVDNTPTLITPVLGVATATSINKVTITAPTTSSTLTVVDGSSLITSGAFALTLTSTAASNATIPAGTNTLYSTKSASITSSQLLTSLTDGTGTGANVFAASPTLTGSPLAPTQTANDNSTKIATTAYVDAKAGTQSIIDNEVPAGTINGSNVTFTLASTPATNSLNIYQNGVRQKPTSDFTLSGNTITFTVAPPTGAILLADYNVSNTSFSVGTNSIIIGEVPSGLVNSSNTVYTTARAYIAGSVEVFINGVAQLRTTNFVETTPASGTITMTTAPITGDIIQVNYQFNLNPSSNADTVDGIHASSTATANQLYPLNSSAKFPVDVLGTGAVSSSVLTSETTTSTTYTDLTTTTDTVTAIIGINGLAFVSIVAQISNNTADTPSYASFAVSGANTISAIDTKAIMFQTQGANHNAYFGASYLLTGLSTGSTTFKMKYRVTGGTGAYSNRSISVIPL